MGWPNSSAQAKSYHSINFGSNETNSWINTWDDWHLVPSSRPLVVPPSVRTSYVEIPGGDGALDLSEALTGYPTYQNRSGSWEFLVLNGYIANVNDHEEYIQYGSWENRYSDIMNYLHGRQFQMVLDDDPNFYYEGRFSVQSWQSPKDWSRITIGYNVGPYKKRMIGTDEDWLWDPFNFEVDRIMSYKDIYIDTDSNEWTQVMVFNDRMRVRPSILTTGTNMYVRFGDFTSRLGRGDENSFRQIVLSEGENTLEFSGRGYVTIKFNGGRF